MAVLLKTFAGVGVADRYREEARGERQHENVQHEMLPIRDGGEGLAVSALSMRDQVPSAA
jgi:hypothetical protein